MTVEYAGSRLLAAEQHVLGSVLLDATSWPKLGDLQPEDFRHQGHRVIYTAMLELAEKSASIDVDTVVAQLNGRLETVGGRPALLKLREHTSTAETVGNSVDALRGARNIAELPPIDAYADEPRTNGHASKENRPPTSDPFDQIRIAIRADLEAGPAAVDDAEPPRFIQHPHLPEAGANLCAPGETGKTAIALVEKIRVACGMSIYPGADVQNQGPCVLVTAEDGAARARYVLQRALRDGMDSGQLSEAAARAAKEHVRIVGWNSPKYGRIVKVDPQSGEMYRAPVYDLLLEILAPIKPVYVTFDPETLFAPGERYGNDGHAFLAAMIHETAMSMQACVQLLDHVSQNVARSGTVDQYASRGGTAKSDEARLVRQLVTVRPDTLKPTDPRPLAVTDEDIAKGSILQLHWTKLSWFPKWRTGTPVWLRRRGYWFEALRLPLQSQHTEETEQETVQRDLAELNANASVVVDYIRLQLATGRGIRVTASELANEGGPSVKGKRLKRDPVRKAIRHALAEGLLKQLELPKGERQGSRQSYLAPADYQPPAQSESSK
jgi:DnaB-like helicase N terminal domain/AAA domain